MVDNKKCVSMAVKAVLVQNNLN